MNSAAHVQFEADCLYDKTKEAKTRGINYRTFNRQMESPFDKRQIVIIRLFIIKEAESI